MTRPGKIVKPTTIDDLPSMQRVRYKMRTEDIILEYIEKHPGSSIKKIFKATELPINTIAPRVSQLLLKDKLKTELCKCCLSTTIYSVKK